MLAKGSAEYSIIACQEMNKIIVSSKSYPRVHILSYRLSNLSFLQLINNDRYVAFHVFIALLDFTLHLIFILRKVYNAKTRKVLMGTAQNPL